MLAFVFNVGEKINCAFSSLSPLILITMIQTLTEWARNGCPDDAIAIAASRGPRDIAIYLGAMQSLLGGPGGLQPTTQPSSGCSELCFVVGAHFRFAINRSHAILIGAPRIYRQSILELRNYDDIIVEHRRAGALLGLHAAPVKITGHIRLPKEPVFVLTDMCRLSNRLSALSREIKQA